MKDKLILARLEGRLFIVFARSLHSRPRSTLVQTPAYVSVYQQRFVSKH